MADVSFGARMDLDVGVQLSSLKLADLSGDRALDLIVSDRGADSLFVLLGNGDGTFNKKSGYVTGSGPVALASADLNGDGHLDVVAPSFVGSTIFVYLGDGDGTLGSPRIHSTIRFFSVPHGLALGDLNRDARVDLLLPHALPHGASILLGNGDGTFGTPSTYPSTGGTPAAGAAIADLNDDGLNDVLIGDRGGVNVHIGNGDGTVGNLVRLEGLHGGTDAPRRIVVGDLNEDGYPDIVTEQVAIWLGNHDGTFSARSDLGMIGPASSVVVADFDLDRRQDIAVTVWTNPGYVVSVLCGKGDGTFGDAANFVVGEGAENVVAGDLDGDARPDLVTANRFGTVSILMNTTFVATEERTWGEVKRAYR